MMAENAAVIARARGLLAQGVISAEQFNAMLQHLKSAPEIVPTPRPDPRRSIMTAPKESEEQKRWIDKLPGATYDTGTVEHPPGLLYQQKGIEPTRKHGDAIDYSTNPALHEAWRDGFKI